MRENTPTSYPEHSNDARVCQYPDGSQSGETSLAWTRTGMIDTSAIIAAVAHAFNDAHPATDVTHAAILSPSRATHVAHARHLCAYLLVEDYRLSYTAAAQALGRADHTTTLNSHTRVVAALDHDIALQQALVGARDILNGRVQRGRPRRDEDRRQAFAAATPGELAEYRYWRLRSLRGEYSTCAPVSLRDRPAPMLVVNADYRGVRDHG